VSVIEEMPAPDFATRLRVSVSSDGSGSKGRLPMRPDLDASDLGLQTDRHGGRMTRIMVMSDAVLPLAEIKKRLSEIVDGVEQRHDRVVLTRHGRPAAVILSPDDLESLEETLDILSDPAALREIRESESAIDDGEVIAADELRAKYLDT
jgi:prevent-host-death family protein